MNVPEASKRYKKNSPALVIPYSIMEGVPAWSCLKASILCDTALEVYRGADIKPVDTMLPQLVDHECRLLLPCTPRAFSDLDCSGSGKSADLFEATI